MECAVLAIADHLRMSDAHEQNYLDVQHDVHVLVRHC